MMQIEKRLKEMHNELLSRDFDKAQESAVMLIADARLLYNTLLLMKEQQDAIREQTASVQKRVPATNSARGNTRQAGAPAGKAGTGQTRH
jgi:hypothetical protein